MISLKWNSNCWCASRVVGRQQQRCQFSRGRNRDSKMMWAPDHTVRMYASLLSPALQFPFIQGDVLRAGLKDRVHDGSVIIFFNKRCSSPHNSPLCAKTIPAVSALSVWLRGQGQYHPFCTMLKVCPWHFFVDWAESILGHKTSLLKLHSATNIMRIYVFHSQKNACLFNNSVKQK